MASSGELVKGPCIYFPGT